MGAFNLDDYETVDSRIKRFYSENNTGRINTELVAAEGAVGATRGAPHPHRHRRRGGSRPGL